MSILSGKTFYITVRGDMLIKNNHRRRLLKRLYQLFKLKGINYTSSDLSKTGEVFSYSSLFNYITDANKETYPVYFLFNSEKEKVHIQLGHPGRNLKEVKFSTWVRDLGLNRKPLIVTASCIKGNVLFKDYKASTIPNHYELKDMPRGAEHIIPPDCIMDWAEFNAYHSQATSGDSWEVIDPLNFHYRVPPAHEVSSSVMDDLQGIARFWSLRRIDARASNAIIGIRSGRPFLEWGVFSKGFDDSMSTKMNYHEFINEARRFTEMFMSKRVRISSNNNNNTTYNHAKEREEGKTSERGSTVIVLQGKTGEIRTGNRKRGTVLCRSGELPELEVGHNRHREGVIIG